MSSPSSLIEGLTYSDEGADFSRRLDTGEIVTIRARNIRRERTGIHAVVAVMLNDAVAEHDNFNISRSEERARLARLAHKIFGLLAQQAYPMEALRRDLGIVLLAIAQEFEEAAHKIDTFDPQEVFPPLAYILEPYIVENGSTVLFAAPESAKSYLAQIWAVSIARGLEDIWATQQRHCLYVSLERARLSLAVREQAVRRVLGIKGASGVHYLHARGWGLAPLATRIRTYTKEYPGAVVFLDSISRARLGDLNSNETANNFIDMMNSFNCAWVGIAHTPRGSDDHIYGSVHYDAGEDVGIKIQAEKRADVVGISLTMVKANDVPKPPIAYYALDFNGTGLYGFRAAEVKDFPELNAKRPMSNPEKIKTFLEQQASGHASRRAISKGTDIAESNLSRYLDTSAFQRLPKQGREVHYAVAYSEGESLS